MKDLSVKARKALKEFQRIIRRTCWLVIVKCKQGLRHSFSDRPASAICKRGAVQNELKHALDFAIALLGKGMDAVIAIGIRR